MRRLLSIAKLTVRQAGRSLAAVVLCLFAVVILLCPALFPAIDASAKVIMLEKFSLGLMFLVGAVASAFLSCRLLPEDFEGRQAQMVFSKPIGRGQILLGRILGATAFVALLFMLMGALSWMSIRSYALFYLDGASERDLLAARIYREADQVNYAGRDEAQKVFTERLRLFESRAEIDRLFEKLSQGDESAIESLRKITGRKFQWDPSTPVEEKKKLASGWFVWWSREKESLLRPPKNPDGQTDIAFGTARSEITWTFNRAGKNNHSLEGSFSIIGLKGNFPDKSSAEFSYTNPNTKASESQKVDIYRNRKVRIEIPAQFISERGDLQVTLKTSDQNAAIIAGISALRLVESKNSFDLNFVKSVGRIFLVMFFLIIVGVCLSSFCSFPVALFAVATLISGGLLRNCVDEALLNPAGIMDFLVLGQNMDKGSIDTWNKVTEYYFRGVFMAIPNYYHHDSSDALTKGEYIPFKDLWITFFQLVILRGGAWFLIAFLSLRKKEFT